MSLLRHRATKIKGKNIKIAQKQVAIYVDNFAIRKKTDKMPKKVLDLFASRLYNLCVVNFR